ncbi:MAG: ABC transporter substrate-binding protein [Chitinispirillaceae bacterium]
MKKLMVLAGAALFIASCGGSKQQAQNTGEEMTLAKLDSIGKAFVPEIGTYGGTIRRSLGGDPDGFSPATSNSGYSSDIMGYIYEGLVTLDPATLEHKPHIAKNWEVSDDGKTWTFNMRDDVFFSDGKKLSAYDVEFTFNDVIYNPKLRSGLNHNFRIEGKKIGVTAVDSFTVRFDLPAPFAPFFTVAGMSIMPKHMYAEAASNGTLESFLSNGADPSHVVGSGPFVLSKVELGQRVVLKRNENYWRFDREGNRLPYIDQIIMPVLKEPNVAMMKFQNGEIDHLSVQGEHYPILKPLEKQNGFKLYKVGPSWYESFFVFNQNNQKSKKGEWYLSPVKQKWFRNKNFRKACAYAVNYEEIINIVYNGLANPPAGIWGAHKGFFHNADAVTYSFNPDTARKLLADEGFKDTNGDGVLEDSDGNPVEFTLTTSSGAQMIQNMYELVRKDLENIGLKVHLQFIEFNNLIDKITNTYDWDVVAYALGGIIDPHFGKSTVTSSSFRYVINPNQKKPSTYYEARIDSIFEVAVSEMDPQKRKELYDEWQALTMDECLKVYMPLKEVVLGVNNRIGNIHLTKYLALGSDLLHNIEELYIKKEN